MKCLYITADRVGIQTGGGLVTHHESEALKTMGECEVLSGPVPGDPFEQDRHFRSVIQNNALPKNYYGELKLAHCYAGCLTESVEELQCMGVKVCYTAAAHDVAASRREHLALGIPYDYHHMTDPVLWERYLGGYKAADVLVCPSQHSADVMRGFGCTQRIVVIPHGCIIPETTKPLPEVFTVGVLGQIGPDKGIRYLLAAWKKLNYTDAVLKIAGSQTTTPFMQSLIYQFGGGNIQLCGWVDNVSDFYSSISVLCQASVTEGFGLEVLEAQAAGRMVLCSRGAGAADTVFDNWRFDPANSDILAAAIDNVRRERTILPFNGIEAREQAKQYTWDKIRQQYIDVWRGLL